MKTIYKLFLSIIFFVLSGCGAVPTNDRYADKKAVDAAKQPEVVTVKEILFDFKPFETKLSFSEQDSAAPENLLLWYHFPDQSANRKMLKTSGYRIQLLSTDDYIEAQKMENSLKTVFNTHQVYIKFESPFYRLRIGDLPEIAQASELQFKLNQLGFKNHSITQDSISIRIK